MNENENRLIEKLEQWMDQADERDLARYDSQAAYALFRQRTAKSHTQGAKPLARRVRMVRWVRAAAVVALVGVAAVLAYMGGRQEVKSSFADIVVEAPQGSRSRVVLPDGTVVWLNAASRLSYSQGFSVSDRRARLSGEGYFEVARREDLPFSVETGSIAVTVKGTKFNLRDYPQDPEAVVALREGCVVAANLLGGGEQTLRPGEQAVVDKQSGRLTVSGCDADRTCQWTTGQLIMDGETLAEVARRLERSYNVSITIRDDSLRQLRFYGDFVRQEQSLREVLDALAATGRLHYRIDGDRVEIY